MAQRTVEPPLALASEVVPAPAPPVPISNPSVPSVTPGFSLLSSGAPQFAVGQWQTLAPPDPVAESILMATSRVLEAPLTPPSQGFVTFDPPSAATTLALGLQSPGQSRPLGSGS